jgi:GLPGLI family protein
MSFINKITLILIMLININCLAQVNYGIVTYQSDASNFYEIFKKKYKSDPNNYALKMFREVTEIASNIDCELIFNKEISIFKTKEKMALDINTQYYNMADKLLSQGKYFTNLSTDIKLLHISTDEEKYIMLNSSIIEWNFINEKKNIAGYECYKATSSKLLPNNTTVAITVWYTPEIPLAFGPLKFVGNLPGLVLEYEDNVVHFIAKKITLNQKKEPLIEWPANVEIISEEQYRADSKKIMGDLINGGR